jgi:hypothetical protein
MAASFTILKQSNRRATERRALVRLRAHLDSRVKVPDLADTEGPITESNCAGAITPGGEQLEVNDQSVIQVNSIRSAVSDEPAREGRSPNKIELSAWSQWRASGREPQMVGDRMVGSPNDVNQGTTAGGKRIGRGQSPRSSEEAGNDRGAKGGRDVVWPDLEQASQKGPGSAARLCARTRRNTGLECSGFVPSGPPAKQVSEAKACAAGATPPKPGVECLSQSINGHGLESRMPEIGPSGLGGGRRRHPFSIHILP